MKEQDKGWRQEEKGERGRKWRKKEVTTTKRGEGGIEGEIME